MCRKKRRSQTKHLPSKTDKHRYNLNQFIPISGVESGGGVKQSPSHQRQTSVDSALSASLTDSGFPSQSNETKPGFRPLSKYFEKPEKRSPARIKKKRNIPPLTCVLCCFY